VRGELEGGAEAAEVVGDGDPDPARVAAGELLDQVGDGLRDRTRPQRDQPEVVIAADVLEGQQAAAFEPVVGVAQR
jgi:hypothetical protein